MKLTIPFGTGRTVCIIPTLTTKPSMKNTFVDLVEKRTKGTIYHECAREFILSYFLLSKEVYPQI